MSGGLYSTEGRDFDQTLDLKKIKPYGDTMNDGKTQLSFTLPVPAGDEAIEAAKQLMKKTGSNPDDIDLVIVATTTPDYHFPSTASILCDKLGLKNAFAFDLQAACSGFLFLMETAANFIRSGRYKKIIIVGADKMSSMVDYTERATCPIFGDGAAAFMVEPTTEDLGIMDAILRTDGKGLPFLHMKAGGSVCPPSYFTVDNKMHYIHQEGRTVFKYAVSNMSDVSAAIAEKNLSLIHI